MSKVVILRHTLDGSLVPKALSQLSMLLFSVAFQHATLKAGNGPGDKATLMVNNVIPTQFID